jgi:tRNA(fMet)-specific endonuclease VapC
VFLLDTNIAIHALQGNDRVIATIADHEGAVALSALSLSEVQSGLFADRRGLALRTRRLDVFLQRIPVLDYTRAAAEEYGRIVAQCGWSRAKAFDRMIAAHAISIFAILVTDNTADFADIPGLSLENWTLPQ